MNFSIKYILTAGFLLLCVVVFGQRYNFSTYSVNKGLPRVGVYDIYEDALGFIWIATEGGGVAVFDGHEFRTYDVTDGLCSDIVRCIAKDRHGRLWFGTDDNGISILNNNHFTNLGTEEGLPHETVRDIILGPDSNMWIATMDGVAIYHYHEKNKFQILDTTCGLPDNKIRALCNGKDGSVWIGTEKGLVQYKHGEILKKFTTEDGLPNDRIMCLYKDKRGTIWGGTWYGAFKIHLGKVEPYTTQQGLIDNTIWTIMQDKEGMYWFGTNGGVSKFNGVSFRHFTEKQGLCNNRVRAVLSDINGNIWFGTVYGGICKFGGEVFTYLDKKEGLQSNQVTAISFFTDDQLAVGTNEGIDLIELKNNKYNGIKTVRFDNGIRCMSRNKDKMLVGTWRGVYLWHGPQTSTIDPEPLFSSRKVSSISVRSDTVIWVGTGEGLYRLTLNEEGNEVITQRRFTTEDGLKRDDITKVMVDFLNRVWVISEGGGIDIIYKNKVLQIDELKKIRRPASVTVKGEMAFVGTSGHGIYSIKTKGKDFIINHLEDENTKRGDYVYSMLAKDNVLWCGVQNGILKVTLSKEGKPTGSVFYGRDEGFEGVEHAYNAIASRGKTVWFGTIKGLVKLNEGARFSQNDEPLVYLTDIELFYQEVEWENSAYANGTIGRFNVPKDLVLPYNMNNLTFNITGIDYGAPSQVNYEWKLEPLESDWSAPKKHNKIVYNNLPPDEYTLHVRAQGISGKWSNEPYTYSFVITPPFYKTIAFYIGASLISLLIIVGIYKWRVRVLKQEQQKLAALVKERTKELEREKRLVESQNREIEAQKLKLQDANEVLEETNEAITDSINYAKRIQYAIMHPKDADTSELEDKLKIFYRPKDIVSGDFYWYNKIDDNYFVCAADCTGHGVPGAFMSMIGITFINDIINKKGIKNPDKILNSLRKQVVNALNEKGAGNTKDGMDLAFYKYNPTTRELTYAGANNPLWIVSEATPDIVTDHTKMRSFEYDNTNGLMLHEIKADKMPIGLSDQMEVPFTAHSIKLQEGDIIWVFSDGYPDQFGGDKGKKFLAKRFKRLLLNAYHKDMDDQLEILIHNFEDWKMDREQVDDILVMGMKV